MQPEAANGRLRPRPCPRGRSIGADISRQVTTAASFPAGTSEYPSGSIQQSPSIVCAVVTARAGHVKPARMEETCRVLTIT
jgi:hypothetical protein